VVQPLAPSALAPGRPDLELDPASGAPRSRDFDDIYFSANAGPIGDASIGDASDGHTRDSLAESDAVFLTGCGLPDAWRGRRQFVVAELGFGSGLNVLALLRAWRANRPANAILHVVSVEGFPLNADQARAVLTQRTDGDQPDAAALAETLLAVWPPRIKGVHRRWLDADGIALTIAHLDVAEALEQLDFVADAWFLDGFAPARNPDMWSPDVFAAIARHSSPGARLATFTVAGAVLRGLEAAGFAVEKKPGFGAKRDRLEAALTHVAPPPSPPTPTSALYPRAAANVAKTEKRSALIIGAGVAGACVARALARRGVACCVVDAAAHVAAGASGNRAGLVTPRLDLDDRPAARFHRAAYAYALSEYSGHDAFRAIGVIRAAKNDTDAERLAALLDAQALPPEMAAPAHARDAGLESDAPGIFLTGAGVLEPARWIRDALADADVRTNATVASLTREGGTREDGAWVARDANGETLGRGEICVVASGVALASLPQLDALSITPSRGQVNFAPGVAHTLTHAAAWGSYVAPVEDGVIYGATYAPWPTGDKPSPDAASDARNLTGLADMAPALAASIDASNAPGRAGATGRASLRATTRDRLPLCGPVPDSAAYRDRFAGVAHGQRIQLGPPAPLHPDLYAIGGLGSRGLTWAPLLGEAIAAHALGEPSPLEAEAAAALHPARTIVRALKRGA